jgi:DNA-binding MarR family transcriptional regulator
MVNMSYEALRRAYEHLKDDYQESQSRCKNLESDNSKLRQQLTACERQRERLAAKLMEVTSDRNWMRGLLENTTIPMREKVTLYGAHAVLERKEAREDGLTHVYRSDISKLTGLTESQVGDALKKLKERGVINRKIESRRDKTTGKHEKINLIALEYAAKHNPKAIDFADESNWGGKREKAETNSCGCGCTERIVTRRVVCKGCGTILDETVKTLGENDLDLGPDEEVF